MDADTRYQPPTDGSEAATLLGVLEHHRDTLRWKCSNLTDQQTRTTLSTSSLTLSGLILHLTMVETYWFNVCFAGQVRTPAWTKFADPEDMDWAWDHAHSYSTELLWTWFNEAASISNEIVMAALERPLGLDAMAATPEQTISLRWIIVHMIEEYARHNGHADLIRESIDSLTGD